MHKTQTEHIEVFAMIGVVLMFLVGATIIIYSIENNFLLMTLLVAWVVVCMYFTNRWSK